VSCLGVCRVPLAGPEHVCRTGCLRSFLHL
jgi:hypothetical protein